MVHNDESLIIYLEALVNSVFKILPLYEEKNIGINSYIDSLLSELFELDKVIVITHGYEYISLLASISAVRTEIQKKNSNKPIIKREVFKCINIVKTMAEKLEGDLTDGKSP